MDHDDVPDRESGRAAGRHKGALADESAKAEAQEYVETMTHDPRRIQEWLGEKGLTYGGLIGVGVIMVQPFLVAESLDLSAMICVVAFALAIPLLAALILLNREESFRRHFAHTGLVSFGQGIAQLSAFVGIVAGFWHIHWIAGAVMLVSAFLGMGVHSVGFMSVEREGGPLIPFGDDNDDV
ncbi:MAG TPA: hypothetical protein VLA05_06465 [Coriobacteriia bacterium]|nr:hypothetical protein [Coriobacteriia bacterium]